MILTDEQLKAVQSECNTLLVACPGSGKTRTIVAKLLRCVDNVRNTPRRIGCITYTNAAVHEIEHRLRVFGISGDEVYCEVSTIHSFCQNNILRHFYWRLNEYEHGYIVLPSDSKRYKEIATEVSHAHGLSEYAPLVFEQLNRHPTGDPIIPEQITEDAAYDFWRRLQSEGYIDFANIVYFTYYLLKDNASLARGLSCHFAWILVDEFQDTSALQVEILTLISQQSHTKFFLVGDPEQSIYSFAGAQRDLMFTFAKQVNACDDFKLLGNYRSSNPIVTCAERLSPRIPPMFPAGPAIAFSENPIHIDAKTHFEAIVDYFLPTLDDLSIGYGASAILAPTWFQLCPLGKRLREYGIPIIGPGARPYKRSHLFARLAEEICAYIDQPKPMFIQQIEKELFVLLSNVNGKSDFRVFTFDGRRIVFRLLRAARAVGRKHEAGLEWLRITATEIGTILTQEGLLSEDSASLLHESVEDMVQDMVNAHVDVSNLSTSDLGIFANPERSIKLMTMHAAKGREFDAVAIIALHDGLVPYHNRYHALTFEEESESRRLLYVSITRSRRILMCITNQEDWRPQTRFLAELRLPSP